MGPERLIDAIEGAGYDVRSYSGRGMFGEECVAFEADGESAIAAVVKIIANAGRDDLDGLLDVLRRASTDSMGLGIVIYFPRVAWPAGREHSDEDAA